MVASENQISDCCDSDLTPRQQPSTTVDSRVQTTATSLRTLNMATNSDRSVTYLLDSGVATLILDGKLWERGSCTLYWDTHRKELRLQLEHTKVSLEELKV